MLQSCLLLFSMFRSGHTIICTVRGTICLSVRLRIVYSSIYFVFVKVRLHHDNHYHLSLTLLFLHYCWYISSNFVNRLFVTVYSVNISWKHSSCNGLVSNFNWSLTFVSGVKYNFTVFMWYFFHYVSKLGAFIVWSPVHIHNTVLCNYESTRTYSK